MTQAPNKAWEAYRGDFNAMTDEQIENELNRSLDEIAEHEDWVEAVASWKEAGKPRDVTPEGNKESDQ